MTYCNEKQMPCEWAQIGGGCSVSACRKVLFTAGGWPMPTKEPEFVKPPMTNADCERGGLRGSNSLRRRRPDGA